MKTAIENNAYFACLALEDVYGRVSVPEPIKVGPGTWVFGRPPVGLDAIWSKWLGSLRDESWAKSKVVILAKERSWHTSGEDVQSELRNRVFAAFYAMLLQGAGYSDSALLLEGEKWKKELSVQSVQDIDGHRRTEGQRATTGSAQQSRSSEDSADRCRAPVPLRPETWSVETRL